MKNGVVEPVAASEVQDKPAGQRRLSFDRTHLGREGADYFARMMANALAAAVPEMRGVLLP